MHSAILCLEIHMWSFFDICETIQLKPICITKYHICIYLNKHDLSLSIVMSQKFTEGKHLLELFTIAQSRL